MYMFLDALINNMIIFKMNIWISRLVIPFLAIAGVIMVMRACLSAFLAMNTVMGWWGCVPIILFPWRFRRCLGRIWHLRAFSFNVSQACKLRSLHNLQWLSYALVINTKFFFLLIPHPGKEPHVCPCDWYRHISNRNHTLWRWYWREINIFYLHCRFGKNWWWLLIICCWWFASCPGRFPNFFLKYPSPAWRGNSSTLMGLTMPWPLVSKPFPSYPILFNSLEPIHVVWFSKTTKSSSGHIHEFRELLFTSHGSCYSFSKGLSLACSCCSKLCFSSFSSCRSIFNSTFFDWRFCLLCFSASRASSMARNWSCNHSVSYVSFCRASYIISTLLEILSMVSYIAFSSSVTAHSIVHACNSHPRKDCSDTKLDPSLLSSWI